jgi:hypothetical protein
MKTATEYVIALDASIITVLLRWPHCSRACLRLLLLSVGNSVLVATHHDDDDDEEEKD